jgi:hypothetical protein
VRTFTSIASGNIEINFALSETHHEEEEENEYGTVYIQDYGTHQRTLDFSAVGTASQISDLADWFRANHGAARPSLLWPDHTTVVGIVAPLYGRWKKELNIASLTNGYYRLTTKFQEMTRGKVAA